MLCPSQYTISPCLMGLVHALVDTLSDLFLDEYPGEGSCFFVSVFNLPHAGPDGE